MRRRRRSLSTRRRTHPSRRPHLSGTKVAAGAPSGAVTVKSVASMRNVALINVSPKKRLTQYILWEHIQNILTRYDASAALSVTSEFNYSFVLDQKASIQAILQDISIVLAQHR